MKGFVLGLMLTLVGCQQLNYQHGFSQDKCYTYKYELKQLTGVPSRWLSSAGIKLACKVDICGVSPGVYRIRMYSVEVFEYNGNSPGPELRFIPSPKLTKSIAAKIENKVVAFHHKNGRVGKFMAPADYSVDGLNMHKGVVGIFQLSIKDKQPGYTLQEAGTGGVCNTTYAIQDTNKANQMKVMKTRILNDCLTKVEKLVGAMYVTPCEECKERNKNSQGTITSSYYIKPTEEEAVIEQADVLEIHQFTPFNEKDGGHILMKASQKLELIKMEEHRPEELPANLKDCGSLAVHFSDESERRSTPVKQLEHQIVDDLQYLAEHTHKKISSDCTKKFQQLAQLMHKANYELYDSVYKRCSSQPACRRIFWDVAASADNPQAIRFLKHKFEQQEITNFEAAQAVLISFHYSSPSLEFIEEAKLLLRLVHQHPHTVLFRTTLLAYASLCQKYCIGLNICPESVLQPVNDFATEVLSKLDDESIVLLLRTYANLQHRSILKTFMKFMPGFATSEFSLRVRHTALLCLKSFAKKDPAWVRSISMQVFLNYKLHYSDRMLAVLSLLSAKPGLPTLTILAKAMFKEPSTQVECFFISCMRMLASSTAPDLQAVASASRMALNIVSSKYERPKYRDGRFFLLSFFKESLMAGMKTEVFILNHPGSIVPRFVTTRFETNFLGNRFSPLEVGIGFQNLPEFLGRETPEPDSDDDDKSVDARKLLKMQSDQKVMPREEPLVGGYLQMFDQNIFTGQMDLRTVVEASQKLYKQKQSFPWISELVDDLQRGVAIQWVKALTSVDASYAVPTCTGLILERSLSHVSITNLAGTAQARFTPELPQDPTLSNLRDANIRLKTKLDFSIDKRMIFRMGIRNSLLQAGLEEYAQLTVNLPIEAAVTLDMKQKRFQLEIPSCKEEINIFSLRSATYAVIGNVEKDPATKSTPVLFPEAWPITIKQSFDSDSSSERSYQQKERPYSESNSAEDTYSAGRSAHQSPAVRQLLCLEADTFGSKTCIKYSSVHAGLIEDVPLNYFVGQHNITWTVYPVQSGPPIEKIQVTVQLGAEAAAQMVRSVKYGYKKTDSSSSSESTSSEKDKNNSERSNDKTSSHDHASSDEAARGHRGTKHSKRPEKLQRSSSRHSDSGSEYSESRKMSRDSSNENRRGTSSRSTSRNNRDSRISREEEQQEGWQNRKHDSIESVFSHQDEKRPSKRLVDKSGKTSGSRAPNYSDYFDDMSESEESSSSESTSSEWLRSSIRNESDSENSGSISHSSSSEEANFLGDTVPPSAIIKVEALRSDNEKQGVQATVYIKNKAKKLDLQLVMIELADTKWNMYLDVDICPYEAQATLSMGDHGREKMLYMKVSKGHLGRKPAIQIKMKSKELPPILRKPASMAMELIPGLAFAMGFTSVYQKNPSDALVLRIAASSPQSIYVDCKVPGETFYKEVLSVLPWISSVVLPQYDPHQEMNAFNSASEIALRLRRADEAVCQVDETSIRTFDDMTFNGSFNENCTTLIAQECTEKPRFTILTRKPKPDLPRDVYIHMNSGNIKVSATWNCSLVVSYNGEPLDRALYENEKANISIYRNETIVVIKAPQQGLENVTYDCETLWVTVSSWMRSKTCGLCGNNDGEKRNEGHMPNHELAYNNTVLFHSWLLGDGDCGTDPEMILFEFEKNSDSTKVNKNIMEHVKTAPVWEYSKSTK